VESEPTPWAGCLSEGCFVRKIILKLILEEASIDTSDHVMLGDVIDKWVSEVA